MRLTRRTSFVGFLLALGSAACFGLSGIFASSLMSAGWSPGAAATARIVLSAAVLLVPTLVLLRGSWHSVRAAWRSVLLFGVLGVAGCQLAFFVAVQFIPPSLALLIEFTGPVLLMLFTWLHTRIRPAALTLVGAAIAVAGLLAISGAVIGAGMHPVGVVFALISAIGNASYFATSANSDHGIAPLPFVGLGLIVAAVILIVVSVTGALPFAAGDTQAMLLGEAVSPWLVVGGMVLVSTVAAYLLGVAGARRLGATVASFTGYSEPMFGILWTALFLAILPTGQQWLGAALIIAGVAIVRWGELRGRTAQTQRYSAEIGQSNGSRAASPTRFK